MEFETNTKNNSPDISDDQRLAASTKRVTLAPLHDITRDDEQVAIHPREDVPTTVQVSNPAVYIPSESEDTSILQTEPSTQAAPVTTPQKGKGLLVTSITAAIAVGAGIALYLVLQ